MARNVTIGCVGALGALIAIVAIAIYAQRRTADQRSSECNDTCMATFHGCVEQCDQRFRKRDSDGWRRCQEPCSRAATDCRGDCR
jgi:hypothetical protein